MKYTDPYGRHMCLEWAPGKNMEIRFEGGRAFAGTKLAESEFLGFAAHLIQFMRSGETYRTWMGMPGVRALGFEFWAPSRNSKGFRIEWLGSSRALPVGGFSATEEVWVNILTENLPSWCSLDELLNSLET